MTEVHIVLAGGGTAGHVNPLLATAAALQEAGVTKLTAVGTREGLETELVPAAGLDLRLIERVPFDTCTSLRTISRERSPFAGHDPCVHCVRNRRRVALASSPLRHGCRLRVLQAAAPLQLVRLRTEEQLHIAQ